MAEEYSTTPMSLPLCKMGHKGLTKEKMKKYHGQNTGESLVGKNGIN